jgi:hypothetical protein
MAVARTNKLGRLGLASAHHFLLQDTLDSVV